MTCILQANSEIIGSKQKCLKEHFATACWGCNKYNEFCHELNIRPKKANSPVTQKAKYLAMQKQ
jgi:hypothetical protein